MAGIPIPQGGLLLQQLLEVGRWQQQHRGGAGGAQLLAGGLAQQAAPARRIAWLQNFQGVQLPVDRVDRQGAQPSLLHQQQAIRLPIRPQHGLAELIVAALQQGSHGCGPLRRQPVEGSPALQQHRAHGESASSGRGTAARAAPCSSPSTWLFTQVLNRSCSRRSRISASSWAGS